MVSISIGTGSVLHCWQILILRGGIKKTVFFSEKLQKGGGLAESEISLSEKLRFFCIFFSKGGGSHLFQKGVIIKQAPKAGGCAS